MSSSSSLVFLILGLVLSIDCFLGVIEVKAGTSVDIELDGSGALEKYVGSKVYTFNFSGPNRGFFTDNATKAKVAASNLQIKGNTLVITKATKADAAKYRRGSDGIELVVL
ncbi:unnamed protein product [Caenorhabditis angaria]|uniref:Uncharacterized protein n=1 Tax=Caenorhabditis angaria TaxID=860376 RepID=A0A9P1I8E8_9PELO|nr:unnamed protein product [Caenorhabditis angaria]